MSGQQRLRPDPMAPLTDMVTVRCRPCHDRGRSAPALARVGRKHGHWEVWVVMAPRMTRRLLQDANPGKDIKRPSTRTLWTGGFPELPASPGFPGTSGGRQIGAAIELISRSCRHRPRVKPRDLYREAEQALAHGQRVIYR